MDNDGVVNIGNCVAYDCDGMNVGDIKIDGTETRIVKYQDQHIWIGYADGEGMQISKDLLNSFIALRAVFF